MAMPSAKQAQTQTKPGLLGPLCHPSDNAEQHLKEIVLSICAFLGADKDRSFFIEENGEMIYKGNTLYLYGHQLHP